MDFCKSPEIDPSHAQFYNAPEQTHYPLNPNPNPSDPRPSGPHPQYASAGRLWPPGVVPREPEPYVRGAGYEGLGSAAAMMPLEAAAAAAGSVAHAAAVVPSNGMQQMVDANPNPMVLSNQRIHPYVSGISVKRSLNVVQSAWCELCKIVCNNQVNLNSHKLGKKHKKNLKKLEESKSVVNVAAEPTATVVFEVEDATTVKEMPSGESSQAEPAATVVAEVEDATTVKEMPSGESAQAEPAATVVLEVEDSTTVKEIPSGESAQGKKARRKSKHEEDLETKRQKLMKGGTAVDSLRACIICNVVCNSETVFQMHLAGQKHAAKVASAPDGLQSMVAPNPNPDPDPDPNSMQPMVAPNPSPDPDRDPKSYPEPNPNPNTDPEPNLSANSKPDPNPNTDPDPNPNTNSKPDPNPHSNPDSDPSPNPNPVICYDQVCEATVNGAKKKSKKTEVPQPVWCELCIVGCTSQEVLDGHKLGKRHKKNLEKLEELKNAAANVRPKNPETSTIESQPVEVAKTTRGEAKRKKAASTSKTGEDLETKKQKLLECGTAADLVKVCTICNVVCNSEMVYNYHLAGQKHATQMRKQAVEIAKSAISHQLVTAATVASNVWAEPVSRATVTTTVDAEPISAATVMTIIGPETVSAATEATTIRLEPVSAGATTATGGPQQVSAAMVTAVGPEQVCAATTTAPVGPQLVTPATTAPTVGPPSSGSPAS